jgi:atypical dual specificity phosphatase
MSPVLGLRRFGVAFGRQVVLANVTLELASATTTWLVGPSGAGKSALLRTLAGLNDAQPSLRTWGEAWLRGRPLGGPNRPALVMQDSRFLLATVRENVVSAFPDRSALQQRAQTAAAHDLFEACGVTDLVPLLDTAAVDLAPGAQRRLAIVRAHATGAPVLLADEPTAKLGEPEAKEVLTLLARIARQTALLVTTHRADHAQALRGSVAMLAGGRIHEVTPTDTFFGGATQSEAGAEWLVTGGCSEPSPDAPPDSLAPGVPRPTPLPSRVRRAIASAAEPRDFYWVIDRRLAGTPRPGVVAELDSDLSALRALGVTVLVTLEETATVPASALQAHGMRGIHVPIPDRHPPTMEQAHRLFREIDARLASHDVLAVHCLAGLGRTGTVLAGYLVHRGLSALDALDRVRSLRPRSVQTSEQVEFLRGYAESRDVVGEVPATARTTREDTR